jgi:hypothetical protein
MISPTNLNNYLTYFLNLYNTNTIVQRNVDYIKRYIDDDYDLTYFTIEQVKEIKHQFNMVYILLLFSSIDDNYHMDHLTYDIPEYLVKVRKILEPIYIKNLWFSRRLLREDVCHDDIGEFLGELPALVRYNLVALINKPFFG